MKDCKDYMIEKEDDLALEYHNKFYCDLPPKLQETMHQMAYRMWTDDYSDYLDHIFDQRRCPMNYPDRGKYHGYSAHQHWMRDVLIWRKYNREVIGRLQ